MNGITELFAGVGILVLVFLIGTGLAARSRSGWKALDFAATAMALGIGAATAVGLLLAYAGFFRPLPFATLLTILAFALFRRPQRITRGSNADLAALAIAVGLLTFGVAARFHVVNALRDHGVYLASGMELGRTGDFGWNDRLVSTYGLDAVRHLLIDWGSFFHGNPRYERMPGFHLTGDTGNVWPQFLHGYELWIGLAFRLAGPQAAQCVTVGFASLALLVIFSSVRQLFGSGGLALGAALLLATNPAQLWFARFPGNEMMIQVFVWGALLLYSRAVGAEDAPGGTNRWPDVYLGLLLLAAAMLMKFAAWGFAILLAFEMGLRLHRRELRVSAPRVWLALIACCVLAAVHAAVFARTYFYGTWAFTLQRIGVSFDLFAPLFLASTAAAFSSGALFGPIANRALIFWSKPPWRALAAGAILLVVCAVFTSQVLLYARGHRDVWAENTNLVEFALYFTRAGFVLAVAGLALLAYRSASARNAVFFIFLFGSAAFLLRRNLEAVHPWGARRWVSFLVPAMCIGMAAPVVPLWHLRSRALRMLAPLWMIAMVALSLSAAPQLIKTREGVPVIPALDRVAGHMGPEDLVLLQPTNALTQYAAYLKARSDVDCYTLQPTGTAWDSTLPIARSAASNGRRILYLCDSPLSAPAQVLPYVDQVFVEQFEYTVLPEGRHALPTKELRLHRSIYGYRIGANALTPDWWPTRGPGPILEKSGLPFFLRMDGAAAGYVRGFYDVTAPPDGRAYRWTNGAAEILVGELLKTPLTTGTLTLTLEANSGREGEPAVPFDWVIQNQDGTNRHLVQTSTVGSGWQFLTCEIPAELITSQTVLRIESPTPPAGGHKAGELGITVESLKIEHTRPTLHTSGNDR